MGSTADWEQHARVKTPQKMKPNQDRSGKPEKEEKS